MGLDGLDVHCDASSVPSEANNVQRRLLGCCEDELVGRQVGSQGLLEIVSLTIERNATRWLPPSVVGQTLAFQDCAICRVHVRSSLTTWGRFRCRCP
jgi:hypothetical protein